MWLRRASAVVFLVDLLRRELDRESAELAQAAMRLNEIEAKIPALEAAAEWVNAALTDEIDADFDADVFMRQFMEAELLRPGKGVINRV
jgi:hypothetical protein